MTRSLSIVVPALDEAHAIGGTLAALAEARARGAEVVVVDGGSNDATVSIAESLADRVIRAQRGRALQLAAGAQAALGDVLWFLHADTRPPPHADLCLLAAVGDAALAWGRFDVRIAGAHWALPQVARLMNLRSRLSGIATGDQGIFATRALFERAGGFPRQRLMEDVAFSREAKRIRPPICLGAKLVTSGRRWERHGVVRTVLLMWQLRLAYFLGADPDRLALRYERGR
jgi:rSAM/selenodomain-associated transferase 2